MEQKPASLDDAISGALPSLEGEATFSAEERALMKAMVEEAEASIASDPSSVKSADEARDELNAYLLTLQNRKA